MANKRLAKNRGKRLARALGACKRCARLAALKTVVGDRPGVWRASCPACGAELRATAVMLNEKDGVFLRRYALCLDESGDPCPHAFTITVDGAAVRDDPACDCGKSRVVLSMSTGGEEAGGIK